MDRSFVAEMGAAFRRAVAPNNIQIHAQKKDADKEGGRCRSSFSPIQISRAG
jgi:hypothetical protein